MEDRSEIIWLNGKLVPACEARISPFDHGFTVGDGVFETLVALEGRPFAFDEHCDRLERGAAVMALEAPERAILRDAIAQLMKVNQRAPEEKTRVRITVTGGPAPPGSARGDEGQTVVVVVTDVPDYPSSAKVVTVPYLRNERGALTGVKTTSYGENVVALAMARKQGASEALFANTKGMLCEGTGSNIFLLVSPNGTESLATPSLESGCLAGVTRAQVLKLCQDLAIGCEERDITMEELAGAEEMFLTSSTRGVQAVDELNGQRLGTVMGKLTSRLKSELERLEQSA